MNFETANVMACIAKQAIRLSQLEDTLEQVTGLHNDRLALLAQNERTIADLEERLSKAAAHIKKWEAGEIGSHHG